MRRMPFRRLFAATAAGVVLGCLAACGCVPPPAVPTEPSPVSAPPFVPLSLDVDAPRFARIEEKVEREISSGCIPGAVILVGHGGKVVYRKAFGNRSISPRLDGMKEDAVFDVGSLTKVVATAPAIVQLAERGRLRLDDPVAAYWPEFAANGKSRIAIRQLLTHTSGLRAGVDPRSRWSSYDGVLSVIAADRPVHPPGTEFRYSDVNFIVLGELVRRVSGLPLDVYCDREIFGPLGMRDTSFRPQAGLQSRIVPTDTQGGRQRWGEVQDPTAHRMGGVAGHAGVFSTADDLAVFAQMCIDRGMSRGIRILGAAAVDAMTTPGSTPGGGALRGLGWDIQSAYGKEHNAFFPRGSYGHTGYTGTSLWIDPRSGTYVIILTSRLHPDGKGQVKQLRAGVCGAVAAAIHMGPPAGVQEPGREGRDAPAGVHGQSDEPNRVRPGIDVLASSGFAPFVGRNIGVITNHTGVGGSGRSTVELLLHAPGVRLRSIFSPEHGLTGKLDQKISSGKDPSTGLPVHSLYGDVKRPTAEMLKGLDALVYDVQDVGVRFYTYITTMAYAMEAAAAAGIDFYVLDRPDPITASMVQGPVLDPALKSFIGYFPLPVRYGMTPGELAQLFNGENAIGVRLHVVRMDGYRRETWFDESGLPWVNPSPNIRSLPQAVLYPGVGLVESANLSVGRGTDEPFEIVGAPWVSGERLARHLNGRNIGGIAFESAVFVPRADRFHGERCEGVRLRLTDRAALDAPALGIELAAALYRLYPGEFQIDRTLGMIGSREILRAIKNGEDPRDLRRRWTAGLDDFRRVREKYLLY